MDRSKPQTSTGSPGFVYFNTSSPNQNYQNKADTGEFLAFNDSPQASPQSGRFAPKSFSSPQGNFQRGSPRNYPQNNRRYNRWSGGNKHNRSFDNSSGYNQSFNKSSSFNQSFNRSSQSNNEDVTCFLHESFLEDPWAPLMAKLKQQQSHSESKMDVSISSSEKVDRT